MYGNKWRALGFLLVLLTGITPDVVVGDGTLGAYDPSITIGIDGFALISYYDWNEGALKVVHCNDGTCSSAATYALDSNLTVGYSSSIIIGSDGSGVCLTMFTTLIDVETLAQQLGNRNWVIVDCRHRLVDMAWGWKSYLESHIPGAVYAHMDHDLSGPPITDHGRHPLPTPEALSATFNRLGIDGSKQVVAYDDMNGAFAARLWWLLRYMGHSAVAVLDGGWQAWEAATLPTHSGEEQNPPATFTGSPQTEWVVYLADVPSLPLLVDSRDPARYRGENETIDPKAGHIPGAKNYYFQWNWGANGRYLPPTQIRQQLELLMSGIPPEEATFYCGSGVTACANLLAMAHAGLGNGRLYAGSWSEWCRDPERPVETI